MSVGPAIRYCAKCLEPDSRPGSTFDEAGVCLPCRYLESYDSIDWSARRREIESIAEWGRAHRSFGYDCIIGVSGGKDSHRQAFFARDELGMRPLLVSCSYPPEQQAERGAQNLANLVECGFDVHVVSPEPRTWKRLMREGFERHGNWCKSTELALYATVPRVAIAQNIPLIFFGENPALAFGGDVGSLDGDANRLRYHNTLAGADLTPWLETGVKPKNLFWYTYPSNRDMDRARLRLVYLGYYMRDFNDTTNGRFSLSVGLEPRRGADALPEETGSINAFDAVDEDFVHLNQFLKYLKLGFGKVTQQVSVKIRLGEMTREEGLSLVRSFDGKCHDRYIRRFCGYLGISERRFWEVVEEFRNLDLWQLNNHGDWELRYKPE